MAQNIIIFSIDEAHSKRVNHMLSKCCDFDVSIESSAKKVINNIYLMQVEMIVFDYNSRGILSVEKDDIKKICGVLSNTCRIVFLADKNRESRLFAEEMNACAYIYKPASIESIDSLNDYFLSPNFSIHESGL